MRISVKPFGVLPDGKQAMLYTLENNQGLRAEITNLGGCIVRLLVPDRHGEQADVVLGHPSFEDYLQNPGFFGALVGRNCNRIAGGQLTIADTQYALEQNDGRNNLHSGKNGLSFRLMSAEARVVGGQSVLLLTHTMEDMSDDFPGNLSVSVAYAITEENALMIDYRAVSDKDTVINLTNHSYFNLGGHNSGPVTNHVLQLSAPFCTPNNDECFPTGEVRSVAGGAFDFLQPKAIGRDIAGDEEQLRMFGGYDHNFLLAGSGYRKVGNVTDPASGRSMTLATNLPAVQLYTANKLSCPGKDGAVYGGYAGFCLETQFVPDAMHMPWLMSPIFRAGEEYVTTTAFQFSNI